MLLVTVFFFFFGTSEDVVCLIILNEGDGRLVNGVPGVSADIVLFWMTRGRFKFESKDGFGPYASS